MKRIIERMFALMLAASLCIGGTGQAIAEEKNTLENLFTYNLCMNPEVAEQKEFDESHLIYTVPPENDAYRARVLEYAHSGDFAQTINGMKVTVLRQLAVNRLCAMEWTIENVSGEPRYIEPGVMTVNGQVGAYSGGGRMDQVLLPGEKCQLVAAMMLPELDGETCVAAVSCREYRIVGSMANEVLTPEDGQLELIGEAEFLVTIDRDTEPEMYAQLGENTQIEWRGSTLAVSEAWQSISDGSYTLLRIFDTYEQAMANNPCDKANGWDFRLYCDETENGLLWIRIGGGILDDVPFELEDGRWAYALNKSAEMMNWLPPNGKVYIVPCIMNDAGTLSEEWEAAIELVLR